MSGSVGHFVPACQAQIVSNALGLAGPNLSDMPADKKQVGNTIRAARERANLSREALAEKVGLDLESIKKIERGERVTQWLRVADFADALSISPNEILGYPIASAESLGMALKPILAAFGANPDDADNIARILLEAVAVAQSSPGDEPQELRYRLAGQLAAAQSRRR